MPVERYKKPGRLPLFNAGREPYLLSGKHEMDAALCLEKTGRRAVGLINN